MNAGHKTIDRNKMMLIPIIILALLGITCGTCNLGPLSISLGNATDTPAPMATVHPVAPTSTVPRLSPTPVPPAEATTPAKATPAVVVGSTGPAPARKVTPKPTAPRVVVTQPPPEMPAPPSTPTGEIVIEPSPTVRVQPVSGGPQFGPITTCEEVTDAGEPVKPGTTFAGGIKSVWFLWNYEGMTQEVSWRREWKRDGKIVTGVDETWAEDEKGWIAYSLDADTDVGLEGGDYTFSLYLEGKVVQQVSFKIGPLPPGAKQSLKQASFSPIVFCEDVTDEGEPVNPTDSFPDGATAVWAFVKYQNLRPGQNWGRRWELNGEEYVDATDQTWEGEDPDGWLARSISEDNGLPEGTYTLKLYLGDQVVQEASVEVAASPGATVGSFGAITFASGMTDDREPIGPAREFEFGINKVYAIFNYGSMTADQTWGREWLFNGEVVDSAQDIEWGDAPAEDGTTWVAYSVSEGMVLKPGQFTLKLYLNGELAITASFEVTERPTATPAPPARPEDLIDADLLPAWYKLASCSHPTIQQLAKAVLKYRIPIRFGNLSAGANASYIFGSETCNTKPGRVDVSRAFWSANSWEEVAGTLGHELWHATQELESKYSCGCTVQKETDAAMVKIYVLQCLGRKDIIIKKFSDAYYWDSNGRGKFNYDKLWRWVKEVYYGPDCPEYEP